MDSKKVLEQLKAAKAGLEQYKSARLNAVSGRQAQDKSAQQLERAACAPWGVKSLNELITINTGDRRFSAKSADAKEAVRNFKEAVDVTLMVAQRFGVKPQQTKAYEELISPAVKALGINPGEAGAEWVPTMVSDSYVEEYNLERKVAGLFTEVKMPSNPYVYPVLSNGAIATKLGEATAKGTPDTFASSSITFSAVKLSNQYALPEELQEDSAVDVMKVIRMELIQGQEKAMEIAILEGDTTSTHQHSNTQIPGLSGVPAADSSERVFDGLRKRILAAGANAKVDAGAQVLNEGHLSSGRQKLGKFGVNPAELAIIVGPKAYNEMLQLDDVRTLEQYGPQAPVLSGELAKYEGIPVIVSEYLREDTDATGINGATAGNNVKLSVILVNRKRWFTGLRRAIQVRVENYRTQFDLWDMCSFSRRSFQGVLKSDGSNFATEKSAVLIFNIA